MQYEDQMWGNMATGLLMHLFEKLEFFIESLTLVLGIDMEQRFVVQVLKSNRMTRNKR